MGYIAAKTDRVTIASGILNIYSRTPALMAMTAAGLDEISEADSCSDWRVRPASHRRLPRCSLRRAHDSYKRGGGDLQESMAPRGEAEFRWQKVQVPLPADQGTGLGKALKIINHPYREEIPVALQHSERKASR